MKNGGEGLILPGCQLQIGCTCSPRHQYTRHRRAGLISDTPFSLLIVYGAIISGLYRMVAAYQHENQIQCTSALLQKINRMEKPDRYGYLLSKLLGSYPLQADVIV